MKRERGCGKRVPGGVYLVTDVTDSRWALPIDSFLFDPPWIPKDNEGHPYYPTAIGVQLVENPNNPGINDVWDWIGEQYYPYFPDFWEETRRFGLSRRIAAGTNFDLLSNQSQIIGFHNKGILFGKNGLYEELMDIQFEYGTGMDDCPRHIETNHICIKHLWQLVDNEPPDIENERLHRILLPRQSKESDCDYQAAYIPYWVNDKKYKAHWKPAALFHLPIHRIEVVKDTLEGKHEYPMKELSKSVTKIPYVLVED